MTIIDDIKTWVAEQAKTAGYLGWDDVVDQFNGEVVKEEIVDTRRWDTITDIVTSFGDDDNKVFVLFRQTTGSTEYQDTDPLDYQIGGGALRLVKPVEVIVTEYVPVD